VGKAGVVAHPGDAEAVPVLDESGFVKKGTKSVGVRRQYSGAAGRIENCWIGVFPLYAGRHGHALIDRALYLPELYLPELYLPELYLPELYLPEIWADDPARRRAAGVPEDTGFATQPQSGRQMLASAFAAEAPCRWMSGDSIHGADYALRRSIERSGRGCVPVVTSRQSPGFKTVADWLEDVPGNGWRRVSAGDGAKGPRLYGWAWLAYWSDVESGWRKGC
jgi:SRSO17 transposase